MFTRSFIAALLSAVAYAHSTANPFKINGSLDTAAGKSLKLEWNPTTEGTVSLILRSGSSSNLAEGMTIASKCAEVPSRLRQACETNTGKVTLTTPAPTLGMYQIRSLEARPTPLR